jgi:hypothetical protein
MSWIVPDLVFNKLTVVRVDRKHVHCRCECGRYVDVPPDELEADLVGECGECGPGVRIEYDDYRGDVPRYYFARLKRDAQRRKIPFELTIADVDRVLRRQDSTCAISGIKVFFNTSTNPGTASVDRKDSSLGYHPDNIQITHKDVNMMKGRMSDDKLLWWTETICKHQKQKRSMA